jgi:hypothetical protein
LIDVSHSVERLIEVRISAPVSRADIDGLAGRYEALAQEITGRLVICVDALKMRILPIELAGAFIELLRVVNRRLEREAFLLPGDHAGLILQMGRVLRESRLISRRQSFLSAEPLLAWLSPQLSEAGRARARDFFAEGAPRPSRVLGVLGDRREVDAYRGAGGGAGAGEKSPLR